MRVFTGKLDDKSKRMLMIYFIINKREYYKWYRRINRFFKRWK